MDYNTYLTTKHWNKIRTKKLKHRPYCQVCRIQKNLQVHHKYYSLKNSQESILFNEKLTTLIVLCNSCHRLLHYYFGPPPVLKINKKIIRIRCLFEYKVDKKMAFYIVSQKGMWESLWGRLKNGELQSHLKN